MTRLSRTVRDELAARYRQRDDAEHRLTSYLLAVLQMAGIDPNRFAGFDDVTGEILLKPEE